MWRVPRSKASAFQFYYISYTSIQCITTPYTLVQCIHATGPYFSQTTTNNLISSKSQSQLQVTLILRPSQQKTSQASSHSINHTIHIHYTYESSHLDPRSASQAQVSSNRPSTFSVCNFNSGVKRRMRGGNNQLFSGSIMAQETISEMRVRQAFAQSCAVCVFLQADVSPLSFLQPRVCISFHPTLEDHTISVPRGVFVFDS